MIEKGHILAEIRRMAEQNGGTPLGQNRFFNETGIRISDWRGRYWARWGDALAEAGLGPNEWQSAFDDQLLLTRLAELTREFGRLPVKSELMLKRRRDPTFPSHNTFSRFGAKETLAATLRTFCEKNPDLSDVVECCGAVVAREEVSQAPTRSLAQAELGYVYLLKSGRYYKIGRSNAVGRRERELAIQLPEKTTVVHQIKTDDPPGIELYWHKRFAAKRKGGEWFDLTADDIAAFKRRKFM